MIIKRDGALGDVLMMTPAIRELRLRNPDEYVGIDTFYPQVFANSPYVDEAAKGLRRGGEDVLNLNGQYERDMARHPVNVYAERILGSDGFEAKHLEVFSTEEERLAVDDWWEDHITGGLVFVVHFGVTWVPMDEIALDDALVHLSKIGTPILIGNPNPGKEYYPARKIDFVDLVGENWTIQMVHWLIQKSDLFFGMDTGPMHIAATTNTPIVCCYSFVDPFYRRPFRDGVPFEAVGRGHECAHSFCAEELKRLTPKGDFAGVKCERKFECSRGITSDMIMAKVRRALEGDRE